ncbi:MAG: hypothetical protein GY927_19680 [bacterium]|nr:hypothetical protein [bacterium]
MKKRSILVLLTTVFLSGCTSLFNSVPTPKMAYIGDLSNNRVAPAGGTIAYAKADNGADTIIYQFKGIDEKGGIHINRLVRNSNNGGKRTGLAGMLQNKSPKSIELVFMPDQTLLVSPGVHVVFVKSSPSELHYRVIMTAG